jgi:hypothetical protein
MNNSPRQWLINPLLIGSAFWLTDGLLYFSNGLCTSIKAWIIIKTTSLPVLTIAVFTVIVNKWTASKRDVLVSGFAGLLFIWLLSAVYLFCMSALSARGIMSFKELGWLLLGFPMTAIEVSSYSGGLWGLIATSICLPIAALLIEKKGRFNKPIEADRE